MLLGAHCGVCTVGELKATSLGNPEQYRCSCGSLIKKCNFWASVSHAMSRRGISEFDITQAGTSIYDVPSPYVQRLNAPLYRGGFLEALRDVGLAVCPRWHSHLRKTQFRNHALVESLQEITGAEWVVDSSKVALRLKYLLRIPNLEAKVIRLIRDGRAVALTYTDEWSFADATDPALRGGGSGQHRKNAQDSMSGASREWRRSNESADCLVATLPRSSWLEVRYEELCEQPKMTLGRICEFLGIDPTGANLDFRSREQHVIGNGMRLDSSSEIRLDERWRTHLTKDDLRIFDQVAGGLNRKYGYLV